MRRQFLLLLLLLSCMFQTVAQNYTFEDQLEFELPEESIDLQEIFDRQRNINRTSQRELLGLGFLSVSKVSAILDHRERYGNLLSIFELQAVKELSRSDLRNLSLLYTANELEDTHEKSVKFQVIQRYESVLDSVSHSFWGSKGRYNTRMNLGYGRFQFSIATETDAGEIWKDSKPDYLGASLAVNGIGSTIDKIILGRYNMAFSQGVIMGGGFGLGKSAATITSIYQSDLGLLPARSLTESASLFGVGTEITINKGLSVIPFYSDTKLDGTTKGLDKISSISYAGYHRNESEWSKRKTVTSRVFGSRVRYSNNQLAIGGTVVFQEFDKAIDPDLKPYNSFYFRGLKRQNFGVDFRYSKDNVLTFGEIARSQNGGVGGVIGAVLAFDRLWDFSLLYRNFSDQFQSVGGAAFSEGQNQNEEGFYWSLSYTKPKAWELKFYVDQYRSKWLKYRVDGLQKGFDVRLIFDRKPSKKLRQYLSLKLEKKMINDTKESITSEILPKVNSRLTLSVEKQVDINLKFKTRLEFNHFSKGAESSLGTTIYQEIQRNFGALKSVFRLVYFDNENFETRSYQYERDLPLKFSMKSYYGHAIRSYLLLNYRVSKRLDFSMKYSLTHYFDRLQIETSQGLISGRNRSDLSLQLRYEIK